MEHNCIIQYMEVNPQLVVDKLFYYVCVCNTMHQFIPVGSRHS